MERWYRDMVSTDWAHACFDSDYEPLRPVLSRCAGIVLDLGGGAGITRRYLPRDAQYVSLDPSLMWLDAEWKSLEATDSRQPDESEFVQGTGEALPFRQGSIDVVLALWSLNHVNDPVAVFAEVRRVLKPGGSFFVVLEDMEPTWWTC
jgi:ubiquinone/menaquinone biosynthesis C-methylase UbiE